MKKFISILVLVCIMASFCTISACAVNTINLNGYAFLFDPDSNNRESISITFNASESDVTANKLVVENYNDGEIVSRTEWNKDTSPTISTTSLSANVVLAGDASSSWKTTWFKQLSADKSTWPDEVRLIVDENTYTYRLGVNFNYYGEENVKKFTQFNEVTGSSEPVYEFPHFSNYKIQTRPEGAQPGDEGYFERITFYIEGYTNPIPDFKAVVCSGNTVISETTTESGELTGSAKTFNIVLYGDYNSSWVTTVKNVGPGIYPDRIDFYSGDKLIFSKDVTTTDEMKQLYENLECVKNAALDPEPVPEVVANPYGVPATADNSNMPLWSALFIAFAAVALLTGKKRRA